MERRAKGWGRGKERPPAVDLRSVSLEAKYLITKMGNLGKHEKEKIHHSLR
jgi:hypothetical protein